MANKLGSLEVELLSPILEYVDDESPKTTKSACLVNKHFYVTARKVGYRRQTLDFGEFDASYIIDSDGDSDGDSEQVRQINRGDRANGLKFDETQTKLAGWLANPEILCSIRHLTINGYPFRKYADINAKRHGKASDRLAAAWKSVAELIEKLGNLKILHWQYDGPIPLTILEGLHKYQPKSELKIYNFQRTSSGLDHNDPAELALSRSPALTAIKAVIWHRGGGSAIDLREAACQRIIANAPNLKYASVTTGQSGCVIRYLSPDQQASQDKMAELFHTNIRPNQTLKTLTLDGYGLSKGLVERWGKFVDFSSLEGLKCSRGFVPDKSYFSIASDLLKNLRHVSLNFASNPNLDMSTAAENYLASCAPLETLSLWSWMKVVTLPTILKHGPTLRCLQLHERESTSIEVARGLLDNEDVREIRIACPQLQEFTMDIDQETESWQDEKENPKIYHELALFGSQLNKVQLYFELGIAAQIAGRPTLTRPAAPARVVDGEEVVDADAARAFSDSDTESTNSDHDGGHQKKRLKQSRLSARKKAMLPRPSLDSTFACAKNIWKTVFGTRSTGEKALDIKIGEWERKLGAGLPAPWVQWEQSARSHLMLRPHERDDMQDKVVLMCHGGLKGRI